MIIFYVLYSPNGFLKFLFFQHSSALLPAVFFPCCSKQPHVCAVCREYVITQKTGSSRKVTMIASKAEKKGHQFVYVVGQLCRVYITVCQCAYI